MKTKEFIKKLKDWDYTIKIENNYIEIYDSEECKYFVGVDIREEFVIDTINIDFVLLPIEDRKALFDLIVEYASTPIEEREEEKKYYLRHRWLNSKHENVKYLVYILNYDEYKLGTGFNGGGLQTQFIQKEIEEIKEKFNTTLEDFEIIEVEE